MMTMLDRVALEKAKLQLELKREEIRMFLAGVAAKKVSLPITGTCIQVAFKNANLPIPEIVAQSVSIEQSQNDYRRLLDCATTIEELTVLENLARKLALEQLERQSAEPSSDG